MRLHDPVLERHEPAASIIQQFGGVRKLARALGIDPSIVSRWQLGPESNGQQGQIQAHYMAAVLSAAKAAKLKIAPGDLIKGYKK